MSAETTAVFEFDGTEYHVDYDATTTLEAVQLKRFLGVLPMEWLQLLNEGDPEAIQFFFWLGLSRAGVNVKPADVDVPLSAWINVHPLVEQKPEGEEENPTLPEAETIL